MLTRKTYTPDLEAKAAPILPGATASVREQVAREQARLRVEALGPQGFVIPVILNARGATSSRRSEIERFFRFFCSLVN